MRETLYEVIKKGLAGHLGEVWARPLLDSKLYEELRHENPKLTEARERAKEFTATLPDWCDWCGKVECECADVVELKEVAR